VNQLGGRTLAHVDIRSDDARLRSGVREQRRAPRADPSIRERKQRLVYAFERTVDPFDRERPRRVSVHLRNVAPDTPVSLVCEQLHEALGTAAEREYAGRDARRLRPDGDGGRAGGLRHEQ
jgi:hypothetical protein